VYRTGQRIPHSGIYRVRHGEHRLPETVTLVQHEIFPRCLKCGNRVGFELVEPVEADGTKFGTRVYALPDLEDGDSVNPLSLALPR
jgi:hypothetical protein